MSEVTLEKSGKFELSILHLKSKIGYSAIELFAIELLCYCAIELLSNCAIVLLLITVVF